MTAMTAMTAIQANNDERRTTNDGRKSNATFATGNKPGSLEAWISDDKLHRKVAHTLAHILLLHCHCAGRGSGLGLGFGFGFRFGMGIEWLGAVKVCVRARTLPACLAIPKYLRSQV